MEVTSNALQTVAVNQDVLFTDTAVRGNGSIMHREGSGIVTLRALTTQCRARFKVSFGANIAVPTGETVGPISLAIAINGEGIPTSSMIETPAAVEEFNNVYSSLFIDVLNGCCTQISVENIGTIPVAV
jgi:hypothetical protein